MNIRGYILLILMSCFCLTGGFGQEEESAEVYLEDYTDEFQERFFEALKQKGIENYDKAINLFLECKGLDSTSVVVDHELAKAYSADKKYNQALEYALRTVNVAPENEWFLDTLVGIVLSQGNTVEGVKDRIPYEDTRLKENLALIYYKRQKYQEALNILNSIKKSTFSSSLTLKIKDSLGRLKKLAEPAKNEQLAEEENPLNSYKKQIEKLLEEQNHKSLVTLSAEALEQFPAQPYFYYAHGLALNKVEKPTEAIEILEAALDYLLDDTALANKIYNELATAHTAMGNTSKANMYLSKIKSGS